MFLAAFALLCDVQTSYLGSRFPTC